jgi:hypothetical protein
VNEELMYNPMCFGDLLLKEVFLEKWYYSTQIEVEEEEYL